jgi:hypothetical protein
VKKSTLLIIVWFLSASVSAAAQSSQSVEAPKAGPVQIEPQTRSYDINDLPFEVEMRRLDGIAKELRLNSRKIVYLIGFNKEGTSKRTAEERLSKSKSYLIKRHGISADRINTLYGGTQDGLNMQIRMIDDIRKAQRPAKNTRVRKNTRKPLRATDDCPPRVRIYFETLETSYKKGDAIFIIGVLANGGRRFRALWKTSSGKITSGQGTLSITVETEKNGEPEITITLRVVVLLHKRPPCHLIGTTKLELK